MIIHLYLPKLCPSTQKKLKRITQNVQSKAESSKNLPKATLNRKYADPTSFNPDCFNPQLTP